MTIRHDFPFDPSNGMTQEQLLAIQTQPEPAGFREFWEETYRLTRAMVPTYFIEREIWSPDSTVKIYSIRAKNWDNTEFVLWIARPEESHGGLVIGQGYGNPATPPACK